MSNDLIDNRSKHLAKRIRVCEAAIGELLHIDVHIRNAEKMREIRARELEQAMSAYDDSCRRVSNLKEKRGRRPEELETAERNLSFFRRKLRDHLASVTLADLVAKLGSVPGDVKLAFRRIAETE